MMALMRFRPATAPDLPELVSVQEHGAVVALSHIFPQDTHPFPRAAVLQRWRDELQNPSIAIYVSTDEAGHITGFAARRHDELLHFGTAIATWGTGIATAFHDALIETYPPDLHRLWLRVFEANARARRFWEKTGWKPTSRKTRSTFAPYPVLVEYELRQRRGSSGATR